MHYAALNLKLRHCPCDNPSEEYQTDLTDSTVGLLADSCLLDLVAVTELNLNLDVNFHFLYRVNPCFSYAAFKQGKSYLNIILKFMMFRSAF